MFIKKLESDVKPIGNYSQGLKLSDFVFISQQLPIYNNKIVEDDIKKQSEQVILNLKNLLNTKGLDLRFILKMNIYLKDLNDYQSMDEVFIKYFKEPYPARTVVKVEELLLNARISVDAIVIDTLPYESHNKKQGECCEGDCCK